MLDGVDLLLRLRSDGLAGWEMIVAEYDVGYCQLFGRRDTAVLLNPRLEMKGYQLTTREM